MDGGHLIAYRWDSTYYTKLSNEQKLGLESCLAFYIKQILLIDKVMQRNCKRYAAMCLNSNGTKKKNVIAISIHAWNSKIRVKISYASK